MSNLTKPVQVLFVHHFSKIGGGETALLDLLNALDKNLVQPTLLCPSGPVLQAAQELGVECKALDAPFRPEKHQESATLLQKNIDRTVRLISNIKDQAVIAGQIQSELKRHPVDVLHIFTHYDALAGYFTTQNQAIRYIITVHSQSAATLERYYAFHKAAYIVSVSNWVRQENAKKIRRFEQSGVIGAGVDTLRFRPDESKNTIRKEFNIPENAPIIGMVGRIINWKRQDVLIKAAPEILSHINNAYFLIIGGGEDYWIQGGSSYLAELKRLVQDLKIEDRVIFTGERRDLPQLYAAMDIVVSAASQETFGRAVAEAMSMGRPVICANIGAIPELVQHGMTGLLTPYGDERMLAKTVCELLSDPEMATRIGKNAAQYIAEHHSMQSVAGQYISIYQKFFAV